MRYRSVSKVPVLILALALLPALALAQTPGNSTSPAKPASATQEKKAPVKPENPPSDYVGAEACKTCHEEIYNNWEKSPHWNTTLDAKGGPSKQGCEACHGAGAAHIADPGDASTIFSFKTNHGKKATERCLSCHQSGKEQMHFERSEHNQNNVGCLDCHSAHHAKKPEFLLVNSQPQLCYGCHLETKPQFNMPFHHRVNEGLVQCNDCHNPHGSVRKTQLRAAATQDEVCFTCHVDKHGPFVYEHDPIKTEGCESCHTPHGSSNPHLLKLSNVNLLCLQCHTTSSFSAAAGTPSFHTQTAQFQACTLCHSQIHGSNFDRDFFK